MKKISTVRVKGNTIFKGHKLTLGLDLGDHSSCYCVLDEAGKIIPEQKVAMTPEAMKQAFAKIPRSLIAMETGTHSPWVSRLFTELGYKVIVAHAQKVQLDSADIRFTESRAEGEALRSSPNVEHMNKDNCERCRAVYRQLLWEERVIWDLRARRN
ncbi:MAG: hypothetical protein WAK48_17865 [Candidatus Acidiferrum sp.]|jgi:hypothetical protein